MSLALVLLLAASAGDTLQVRSQTCADVDAAEVERLVELELAAVTQEIRDGPPLQVDLVCEGDVLTMAVTDPLTSKQLSRTVPAPGPGAGRSRVIALAIAQLFAASWLELLLADPPADEDTAPPVDPEPGTVHEAVRAATELVEARVEPKRAPTLELLAAAGARGRALETAPMGALHLDLELRDWLGERVGLAGRLDVDLGRTLRAAGQVQALGVQGNLGLTWRTSRQRVAAGGAVLVGVGYGQLRGISARDDVQAAIQRGATGQVLATVGPRIAAGRLRIDVDAEFGYALRTPQGLISDDDAVTLGGIVVGACLRLGGTFGGRAQAP